MIGVVGRRSGEIVAWHPLLAHSADVAAVTEEATDVSLFDGGLRSSSATGTFSTIVLEWPRWTNTEIPDARCGFYTENMLMIVVKKVPALVCDTCGDVTYSEAIGRRLSEMYEAVKKAGVDMAVRSFEKKATA